MTAKIVNRKRSVVVAPVRPRIVTLDRQTVARLTADRGAVVRPEVTSAVVRPRNSRITVSNVGRPGRDGRDGRDAAGSISPIAFGYGDAPHVIYTAAEAGLLTYCRIIVRNIFSPGATLRIGLSVGGEEVMPAAYTDLSQIAEYENTPDVEMNAGDQIYISISPNGSTSGDGEIILQFLPD